MLVVKIRKSSVEQDSVLHYRRKATPKEMQRSDSAVKFAKASNIAVTERSEVEAMLLG